MARKFHKKRANRTDAPTRTWPITSETSRTPQRSCREVRNGLTRARAVRGDARPLAEHSCAPRWPLVAPSGRCAPDTPASPPRARPPAPPGMRSSGWPTRACHFGRRLCHFLKLMLLFAFVCRAFFACDLCDPVRRNVWLDFFSVVFLFCVGDPPLRMKVKIFYVFQCIFNIFGCFVIFYNQNLEYSNVIVFVSFSKEHIF